MKFVKKDENRRKEFNESGSFFFVRFEGTPTLQSNVKQSQTGDSKCLWYFRVDQS